MNPPPVRARHPVDPRVDEVRRFALESLQASSCVFYWTDESMTMQDVELSGACCDNFQAYIDGFHAYDPCSVPRLVRHKRRTATLRGAHETTPSEDVDLYMAHVQEGGFTDVLELLFWQGETAFAGLGILKTADDPPICGETLALAATMQRYIEFNFLSHPRLSAKRLHDQLRREFVLTEREVEVTNLLRYGCRNDQIAEELGITVATVKSHVFRIFDKLGIDNRASVVAKISTLEAEVALAA